MLSRRVNVNGDFSVWQWGPANARAAHARLTADTYYWQDTTGAEVRIERDTDVPPASSTGGAAFRYSMRITVLKASKPLANQVAGIVHTGTSDIFQKRIRGRRPAVTYYMKANGHFVLSYGLRSNDPYKTFTCRAAIGPSWSQQRTLMAVAPDTDWGSGGAERGYANFLFLGGGADFAGILNAWGDGPTGICADQTNFLGAVGNTLWIAGHQLEADEFTPYEQRSYEDDEFDCMRFIQKSFLRDVAPAAGLATHSEILKEGQECFPVTRVGGDGWQAHQVRFVRPMITKPQLHLFNPIEQGATFYNWSRGVSINGSVDWLSERGARLSAQDAAAAAGDTIVFGWLADASVGPG